MSLKEDRLQVRTQIHVNMVVEAGAGTGKTTLLIERLCLALLAQGVEAERLVALTFTEKAAAEIKTRLVFKLQEVVRAIREERPDAVLKILQESFRVNKADILTRAEQALAHLDRSQIGTIHSFCADILRLYPLEAGLTPGAEVDKGPRARRILDSVWNSFLDKELGENAPRAEQWKQVLSHVSLTDLYNCVREMCSGKVGHYNYFAQKDFLAQICAQRAEAAAQLSGAFLDGNKKPRVIEQALQQAARRFTQAKIWLETGALPQAEEETIVIKSVPKDWDERDAEEAKALCRFAQQADPFVQTWILNAYNLLSDLVKEVRASYEIEGILSFDDLIIRTRDLVQNNLLVRRLLQEKYDVLYVDEFQDTDPAQGEILLYLAEQKGNGATRWQDVKLTPGKLFVVGDPKQSIYRFRGADITAYELFTDLILRQGGKKAYLRQNFRSQSSIIDLTNEVCSVVMTEKPAFQPPYEPIFTDKNAKHEPVELVLIDSPETKIAADDYRHNQAEFVAEWIAQNVGKLTLQNGQKLRYQDIAILSRASTTLWPYTDALRRWAIPFSVEEDKDFYTRQEIADFLNILRVLDDSQDHISLVGVMRSPLGALTDEEIYQASVRNEMDYRLPSTNEKLEKLFVWLRELAAQVDKKPLHDFLLHILQHSVLAEVCAWAYDGQRSIDNLQRLVSLASSYALQTPSTLGQFLARVQDLMEEDLSQLTALPEGESAMAVNVMTVHKSKGLEFPVVILVDISKKETSIAAKRPSHLYEWSHNLHGFLIGQYADINLAWLEEQQRQHALCEEIRVLYVALTRAREKLIIVGNKQTDRSSIGNLFYRSGMFPAEQEQPATLGKTNELSLNYIPYRSPKNFIYTIHKAKQTAVSLGDLFAWRNAHQNRLQAYEKYQKEQLPLVPSMLKDISTNNESALQMGVWVHAVLSRRYLYEQEPLQTTVQTVALQATEQQQADIVQLMENFYHSAAYQTISAMKMIGTEMPFSLNTTQGVVSGVIDLLAEDKEGGVWVFDYKTDQVQTGQEEQAAQKYADQLGVYVQAVQKLYPTARVKSAVVFVLTTALVELSVGGENI